MRPPNEGRFPSRIQGIIGPSWFHHHGIKFRVENFLPTAKVLRLKASAAEVEIHPSDIQRKDGEEAFWQVSWVVRYSRSEKVEGTIQVSSTMLRMMFGLAVEVRPRYDNLESFLYPEYGADDAYQGYFIRYKDWLNIPGPGTGHDGDPNVSIEITDDMRAAVNQITQ